MEETHIKPAFKCRIPVYYRRHAVEKVVLTRQVELNLEHPVSRPHVNKLRNWESSVSKIQTENIVHLGHTILIAQQTNVRSLVFWAAVKLLPPNDLLRKWDISVSWDIQQNLEWVGKFKNVVLTKLIAEAFVSSPKVYAELLTLESCWQSGISTPLWAGDKSKGQSIALKSCRTRTKMKQFRKRVHGYGARLHRLKYCQVLKFSQV